MMAPYIYIIGPVPTDSDSDSDSSDISSDSDREPELTPAEAADLCRIVEEQSDSLDPAYIDSVLSKAVDNVVAHDNARVAEPSHDDTAEIAAVIEIQEGRVPDCDPEVLHKSLENISSGSVLLDKEDNSIADDRGLENINVAVETSKKWCIVM